MMPPRREEIQLASPAGQPELYEEDREPQLQRAIVLLALASAFVVGFNPVLFGRVTATTVAVLALSPIWIGHVSRFRGARIILSLAALSVFAGYVLTAFAPVSRMIDSGAGRGIVIVMITDFGALGMLLWTRDVISRNSMVMAYASGALLAALPHMAGSGNVWKYQLSMPVTLLALALAGRAKSTPLAVGVLIALGLIGIMNDSRSYFGMCLMAALLISWHERTPITTTLSRLRAVAFMAIGGALLYMTATTLIVSGALGEEVRDRSLEQISNGGGLLLGGRPEWAASMALFVRYPSGFGLGAVPNMHEVLVAKQGLARVGLSGANGYVDHYMFGRVFELHSVLMDFWAWFGLVGLVLGLTIGGYLLWGLTKPITEVESRPAAVFAGIFALWFLAFGPFDSNLPDIVFALALLLALKGPKALSESQPRRT